MDDDSDDFEEFAKQVRDDTVPKMRGSRYVVQISPDKDDIDIKVAVEIGLAILLDKPLIVLADATRIHCPKLLRVADHVITGDINSDKGRQAMFEKLEHILKQ